MAYYSRRGRLCVVGPSQCGKSALVTRFIKNRFEPNAPTAITCLIHDTLFPVIGENKMPIVKVIIDDTSGQAQLMSGITANLVRYAQYVLLCCDLSSEDSLQEVKDQWWPWCQMHVDEAMINLVGLKADMAVPELSQAARDWAKENDMSYIETSAKDNTGVEMLAAQIGSYFHFQSVKWTLTYGPGRRSISLDETPVRRRRSTCNC